MLCSGFFRISDRPQWRLFASEQKWSLDLIINFISEKTKWDYPLIQICFIWHMHLLLEQCLHFFWRSVYGSAAVGKTILMNSIKNRKCPSKLYSKVKLYRTIEIFMCFKIICKVHISSHLISQNFRDHGYSTLLFPTAIGISNFIDISPTTMGLPNLEPPPPYNKIFPTSNGTFQLRIDLTKNSPT